jgi:uncharacterized protein YcbK (DUF882 family)
MGRLSEHFDEREFLCRCGCGGGSGKIHPNLVMGLEMLRDLVKLPIVLTCAYRCPAHNAAVGGVRNSYHVQGMAADIYVAGLTPQELAGQAARVPLFFQGGIGIYPQRGFVHVDVGHKRRWMG